MKIKLLSALTLFSLVTACGAADRLADCHSICDRYQDCFDESYDVSACRDRCTNAADNDRDFERKVDSCDVCIDDRSCTSSAFNCATECADIVP